MAEGHKGLLDALLAFQAEAPTLPKDATNPHFKSKFTPLDTIVETVRPLLAKHGLVWTTMPCRDEHGDPALRYRLSHAATGEAVEDTMPLLLSEHDSQGLGSAVTYARRYSISAVLNLVADDDDDGNQASRRQQNGRQAQDGPVASPQDVEALVAAAKGLKAGQLRMALAACGVEAPQDLKRAFEGVPQAKTAMLAQTLAGVEREA